MSTSSKKKVRAYKQEYLHFGFIENESNKTQPLCILCEKTFSNEAMKPSRLKGHLKSCHSEHLDKDLEFFRKRREERTKQGKITNMFKKSAQSKDDGQLASYYLSLIIAKHGLPHSIGEKTFIPVLKTVLEKVIHYKNTSNVLRSIPLSNNTVKRRIDEVSECVEQKLVQMMCENFFSMQVDESTLPGGKCLILVCVRLITNDTVYEELALSDLMETHSTGKLVFDKIIRYFQENKIPSTNLIGIATDGAPSMIGKYRGLITHFKDLNPNIFTIHCVIHRQHLVAKNLSDRLNDSLNLVIKAVNKIKRHALQGRLFKKLCNENDEVFDKLIIHTEVRWLSKGNCLERFLAVFNSVIDFFAGKDSMLADNLVKRKLDIAYMSDLYGKFNHLNKTLQGKNLNLVKVKSKITSFRNQLELYGKNFKNNQFAQFSSLENLKLQISEDEVETYSSHLEQLKDDMDKRFNDVFQLNVPKWVVDPFEANLFEININLQETFADLQNDLELKVKFSKEKYESFWTQQQLRQKYPLIWEEIRLLFIAFPSSYIVEKAFSSVINILSKRSNLDICKGGDLRLFLTDLEPDIETLAISHQAHPSH